MSRGFGKIVSLLLLLIAVAAIPLGIKAAGLQKTVSTQAAFLVTDISLGPEEVVYNSNVPSKVPDYPFFTFESDGGLVGVLSGGGESSGQVYKTTTPKASKFTQLEPISGMVKGSGAKDFDNGGIWPNGTFQVEGTKIIHGFYHAENYFDIEGRENKTNYTAAYMRSADGGKSWEKPGYPQNVILTGYDGKSRNGGADPYSLVRVKNGTTGKDELYLYYFEHTGNLDTRGMAVAKASVASGGIPGAWKKYFCKAGVCDFSEPGIGGNFTKLENLNGQSWISFNSDIDEFVAVDGLSISTLGVVQLKRSEDGIIWENLGDPIPMGPIKLPNVGGDWKRAYLSLLSKEGKTGEIGKKFYLYYVLVPWDNINNRPNDSIPRRQLIRREITLNTVELPDLDRSKQQIKGFYNKKTIDHLYTADENEIKEIVNKKKYVDDGTSFWVFRVLDKGRVPLVRIDLPNGRHVYSTSTDEIKELLSQKGAVDRGHIGYCYTVKKIGGDVKLVRLLRLYNPKTKDRYYSTDKVAVEKAKEYGYIQEKFECFTPKG